jgi:hypothetical protein
LKKKLLSKLLAQNKNSNTSFDTETKFWPRVSGQGLLVARISKTQMPKYRFIQIQNLP